MSRPDLMDLAEAERTDLLAFLRTLTAEQWATKSLCSEWTVRDVALHLVSYEELSTRPWLARSCAVGIRMEPVNDFACAATRISTPTTVHGPVESRSMIVRRLGSRAAPKHPTRKSPRTRKLLLTPYDGGTM